MWVVAFTVQCNVAFCCTRTTQAQAESNGKKQIRNRASKAHECAHFIRRWIYTNTYSVQQYRIGKFNLSLYKQTINNINIYEMG